MTTTRTSNKNAVDLISNRIGFTGSNFYGVVTAPKIDNADINPTGMLPVEFHHLLEDAEYIVYSYGTPIFWYASDCSWNFPKVKYSPSTSRHQSICQKVQ
jgi:hypothetical protein